MPEMKDLLSRLFGGGTKSSCCSIRIEEVPENEQGNEEQGNKAGIADTGQDPEAVDARSSCCGGGNAPQ